MIFFTLNIQGEYKILRRFMNQKLWGGRSHALIEGATALFGLMEHQQVNAGMARFNGFLLQCTNKIRNLDLLALRIKRKSNFETEDLIDDVYIQATTKRLEIMDIDVSVGLYRRYYSLPPFNEALPRTIKVLTLKGLRLGNDVCQLFFPCLEELTLKKCYIEGKLDDLIGQCGVLRDFICEDCDGMKTFTITNQSLVRAVVNFRGKVILETPQLRSVMGGSRLEFLGCYGLISNLALSRVDMTSSHLKYLISEMPLLESLEVFHCYQVEEFEMASNKLRRLSLSLLNDDLIIGLEAPSLKVFKFIGAVPSISSMRLGSSVASTLRFRVQGSENQFLTRMRQFVDQLRGTLELTILGAGKEKALFADVVSSKSHLKINFNLE